MLLRLLLFLLINKVITSLHFRILRSMLEINHLIHTHMLKIFKTKPYIFLVVFFLCTTSVIFLVKSHYSNLWQPVDFNKLPNWGGVNYDESLQTFISSCQKVSVDDFHRFHLDVSKRKWQNICLNAKNTKNAKLFFEDNFRPYTLSNPSKNLFTSYFAPYIEGRLTKSQGYSVPIYAKPNDLVVIPLRFFSQTLPNLQLYGRNSHKKIIPYHTRKEIYEGQIKDKAKVLAWIENPWDAFELEIQGAGVIHTPQKNIFLNYASENGHRYQPIGKFLIADGKISKQDLTMLSIRNYFLAHPKELYSYLIKNPSYIFFKETKEEYFLGFHDIHLHPGFSVAVDRQLIPIGIPIFLNTTLPNQKKLHRLMVAQDVGGAIKGWHHLDIYAGFGTKAQAMASTMKASGNYWLLLPK